MPPVLDLEPHQPHGGTPAVRPEAAPPGLSIGDAVALPLLLVALMVAVIAFAAAAWGGRGFAPLLLAQIVAGPAVLALAVRWSRLAPAAALTLRRFPARILPAVIVASLGLVVAVGQLVPLIPGSRAYREAALTGFGVSSPLVVVLSAVIAAPVVEELLCRGVLLRGLLRRHGAWTAALVTTLVFALFHLNLTQGLLALPFGLGLAWLALRTGSVIPGMVAHAAVNGSSVLVTVIVLARGYTPRQILAVEHTPAAAIAAAAAATILGAFVVWWQLRDYQPPAGDVAAAGPRATVTPVATVLRPALAIAVALLLVLLVPRGMRTLSVTRLLVPETGPPSSAVVAASGCYALELSPALAPELVPGQPDGPVALRLTTTRYRIGNEHPSRYLVRALGPAIAATPRDTAPVYWIARGAGGISIVAGHTLLNLRPRAGHLTGQATRYDAASGAPAGSAVPVIARRIAYPRQPPAR